MSHTPEHTEGEYKANQDQSPVDCAAKGKKPWDISSPRSNSAANLRIENLENRALSGEVSQVA